MQAVSATHNQKWQSDQETSENEGDAKRVMKTNPSPAGSVWVRVEHEILLGLGEQQRLEGGPGQQLHT